MPNSLLHHAAMSVKVSSAAAEGHMPSTAGRVLSDTTTVNVWTINTEPRLDGPPVRLRQPTQGQAPWYAVHFGIDRSLKTILRSGTRPMSGRTVL